MTPFKVLDLKHIIVAMKEIHKDQLALADDEHRFRLISNISYENRFALKLANAKVEHTNRNIDFTYDGKYFAFCEEEKHVIRIINIQEKKVLHSLIKYTQEIESLSFSPNGKYLASGGMDGKVFLWNISKGSFISRFPSHPDYVAFFTIFSGWKYINLLWF